MKEKQEEVFEEHLVSRRALAESESKQLDLVEELTLLREKVDGMSNEFSLMNEMLSATETERDMLLRSRGVMPKQSPMWASQLAGGVEEGEMPGLVRIWVGSWNMGATDPFDEVDRGRAPKILRSFVPQGYDIYLFGVQEATSDSTFQAIESLLGMDGCVRIRLDHVKKRQPSFHSSFFKGIFYLHFFL